MCSAKRLVVGSGLAKEIAELQYFALIYFSVCVLVYVCVCTYVYLNVNMRRRYTLGCLPGSDGQAPDSVLAQVLIL